MRTPLLASSLLLFLSGCAAETSYVHTDTTLGRVVVYRNGIAYFERTAADLALPAEVRAQGPAALVDAVAAHLAALAGDPEAQPTTDAALVTAWSLREQAIAAHGG